VHTNWKRLPAVGLLIIVGALAVAAQTEPCPPMPEGRLCISQAAGDQAVMNAKLVKAQEAEIAALKQAVLDERETTRQVQATAAKNEADLKASATKALVDLGTATGQLIEARATIQTQNAMLQFMLTNGRNKCGGFTLICIQ
jgi:hypothetical protein